MRFLPFLLLLSMLFSSADLTQAQVFEPTWESLTQYEAPDWFRDAKYGLFVAWGVQSIPGVDGWYARHMYVQEGAPWGASYDYHVANYGHPSEFGFKDLIPLWTAEHWDPNALAQLYKEVGARYVVPIAVHHDNFDLYNSAHQPWNSVNMGPQRDILAEWKAAVEQHGLRFGTSTHTEQTWWWFQTAHGADVSGPLAGVPYDGHLTAADGVGTWWEGYDPQDLYWPYHDPNDPVTIEFAENWFQRHLDLLEQYEPDLLFIDGQLPFVWRGLTVAANLYNQSQENHDGRLEAVLNVKYLPPIEGVEGAVVQDIEKGQSATLRPHPWQADIPLTVHYFFTHDPVRTDTLVVHNLCDIVSKNGNLLLGVGLRADGTLPAEQEAVLRSVGDWLEVNGEAIYETRPWVLFGEGPSVVEEGEFNQLNIPLTPEDVRFTTRGDTLYAIFFGRPESGFITIDSLATGAAPPADSITAVEMLGYSKPITWAQDATGMTVTMPDDAENALAYVLRITSGKSTETGEDPPGDGEEEPEPAEAFSVRQFPNPFSGTTRLYVQVPERESVTTRIFDLQGRLVRQYTGEAEPGVEVEFTIDTQGLASGIYFGHVTAGSHSEVVRLVHLSHD